MAVGSTLRATEVECLTPTSRPRGFQLPTAIRLLPTPLSFRGGGGRGILGAAALPGKGFRMKSEKISELTTSRLSVYLRCLNLLAAAGIKTISSQALADQFRLNSAQIRKDLAHFGEFGTRGVGYSVGELRRHLTQILGLDRAHRVLNQIMSAGVKAVLNFAPVRLHARLGVKVKTVDLTISLESLSYFLARPQITCVTNPRSLLPYEEIAQREEQELQQS